MATKSASNVMERKPVSQEAKADVKGTHGSGYAVTLIKFLESKAETEVKVQSSLKEKLKGFYDFSDDDFTAYADETRKFRDSVKVEAEKAKMSVTEFRRSAPGMDYVYVNLSVFDMLARAVKTGWRPEVDRLTWAAIQAEARDRLDSVGKAEKRKTIDAELAKWEADPKADPEVKQANILILNKAKEELVTTTRTKPAGTRALDGGKSGFQKAVEMLDKLPIHELELVKAWLDKRVEAYNKAKPGVSTTTAGDPLAKAATKTEKAEGEHATAHAPKRRSRK